MNPRGYCIGLRPVSAGGPIESGRLRDALKLLCTYLRHEGVRSCRRPTCPAVKVLIHEIRKMADRTDCRDAVMKLARIRGS
jgi:hypothetical protein